MANKTIKKPRESRNNAIDFPLEKSFGFLIRKTYHTFLKVLEERISKQNVTIQQWFFLRVLWEEDGLTQRDLSNRVGITASTTVAAMKVMQCRDFIRCRTDKTDKRRKKVFLTEAGRKLENILLPEAYEVHLISREGLSQKQLESTHKVILQMKNNLEIGDEKRLLIREIKELKDKLKNT